MNNFILTILTLFNFGLTTFSNDSSSTTSSSISSIGSSSSSSSSSIKIATIEGLEDPAFKKYYENYMALRQLDTDIINPHLNRVCVLSHLIFEYKYRPFIDYKKWKKNNEILRTVAFSSSSDNVEYLNKIKEIKELLEFEEIDVNTKDEFNNTSLGLASISGNKEIVELLLKNNIDVNAQNINGFTALHHACANGHLHIVKLLVEHRDIKFDIRNYGDRTALRVALDEGHIGVYDFLRKFIAEKFNIPFTSDYHFAPYIWITSQPVNPYSGIFSLSEH